MKHPALILVVVLAAAFAPANSFAEFRDLFRSKGEALYKQALESHRQKEYQVALVLFQLSAHENYADAMVFLGIYHEAGWGTPPDTGKAVMWYRKAAIKGNVVAQQALRRLGYTW